MLEPHCHPPLVLSNLRALAPAAAHATHAAHASPEEGLKEIKGVGEVTSTGPCATKASHAALEPCLAITVVDGALVVV